MRELDNQPQLPWKNPGQGPSFGWIVPVLVVVVLLMSAAYYLAPDNLDFLSPWGEEEEVVTKRGDYAERVKSEPWAQEEAWARYNHEYEPTNCPIVTSDEVFYEEGPEIGDMDSSHICWTVPWAKEVLTDGREFLHLNYIVTRKPFGTSGMQIKRCSNNTFVVLGLSSWYGYNQEVYTWTAHSDEVFGEMLLIVDACPGSGEEASSA